MVGIFNSVRASVGGFSLLKEAYLSKKKPRVKHTSERQPVICNTPKNQQGTLDVL